MKIENLAWAAGLIDGDGCIATAGPTLHLTASQVDREGLDRFRDAVSVGTVGGPYPPTDGSFGIRDQFTYSAYGKNALSAISKIWFRLGDVKRSDAMRAFVQLGITRDPESSPALRIEHRSRIDLAWAAGFFDAEGCFSDKSARIATITQTDRQILERFLTVTGVGRIYGPYQPATVDGWSRKPALQLRTNSFEHTQALAAMLWFKLGTAKKEQAIRTLSGAAYCKRGHFKEGAIGCPRCVAEAWERKRAAGLCRKGHDKMGLPRCPTCSASDGRVGEDPAIYAA